ncbi:FAD-binding protein [Mesorhizobium sp. M5C.F.Ca.IN.020.29.1.1]|uniref:NAD(P)-binding domain-containing protein n=1 Tax=unclassified Mesorhizobium TaxID=325217 RepID=UPI000FCC0D75|nr:MULTISPECIES: NAD(P)-binding domain-containing protein [unclassified Mesorhizobium]RUV52191.1 FAD-binding protein [Mesorhizobium sp. M5C.F.Ca.IN.020.29.1.1]TIM82325.1 MAG: FAD-binding protein [Mesorhizobium sp.]
MIGAGAAGLAAAHALIKAGVPILVLEKESRLAELWYRRHERLHLNSYRDLSTPPGVDYPAGTPAFPHKNAVVRHLNEFSQAHGLPVRLGVAVEEIAFNGDYWTGKTSAGRGRFEFARPVVYRLAARHSRLLRQCPNSGQRNYAADRQAGAMIQNWGGASGRKQPNS